MARSTLYPLPPRDVIGVQAPLGEQLLHVTVGKREAVAAKLSRHPIDTLKHLALYTESYSVRIRLRGESGFAKGRYANDICNR